VNISMKRTIKYKVIVVIDIDNCILSERKLNLRFEEIVPYCLNACCKIIHYESRLNMLCRVSLDTQKASESVFETQYFSPPSTNLMPDPSLRRAHIKSEFNTPRAFEPPPLAERLQIWRNRHNESD
jgi:hypothetical protein